MKNVIRVSLAAVLAVAVSTPLAAQSDFNFPTGAGAAVTSSVVNYGGGAAFSAATVPVPGGGTVAVPQATRAMIMAVMGPGTGPVAQLTSLLGGGAQAGNLVTALSGMGANLNLGTATTAVNAFNAYIASLPPGTQPSPAAAAIRQAIAVAIATGSVGKQ